MKLSKIGRIVSALVASAALGLGMTACGGGTIGYMWVVGNYASGTSGQIYGFKIDNYTGNLTVVPGSPFSAGGTNPATILVKLGGRFVYVINSGTPATAPVPPSAGNPNGTLATQSTAGSITEYSVGGEGVLTYQQTFFSQGIHPMWATFDSSGNYMYVLDQYAPDFSGNGSITAFATAGDTGRLSLVPNTSIKNMNGTPTAFFEVGANPIMSKIGGSGCLLTMSSASRSFPSATNLIFPYQVSGSNGQLTLATTGPYTVSGSASLTSINTGTGTSGAAYTYLTDGASNQIFGLTSGSGCSLAPITGGQQANLPTTQNPVYSITSNNGKFLYVVNQSSTTNTQSPANSTISAFTIDSTGRLAPVSSSNNPYSTGSGPVCAVQDPSNQYLYTSNNTDGSVTGKAIRQDTGELAPLTKGSVFPTTTKPTCLVVSGSL